MRNRGGPVGTPPTNELVIGAQAGAFLWLKTMKQNIARERARYNQKFEDMCVSWLQPTPSYREETCAPAVEVL